MKDFLAFAFTKKQSKVKKAKEQRWSGMREKANVFQKKKSERKNP